MATAIAPFQKTTTRIAALDGWRGIAILMVLEAHFWAPTHPWSGHWGRFGVTIFFVLSGYLITGNLLREMDNGGISLRRFYLRRIFRLWPCAWTYQAVVLFLFAALVHRFMWRDALKCIAFVRNFSGDTILTEHFWSLSIEEQFYLVWPLMLVVFRKRAARIAVAGIVFVAIFRVTHWAIWADQVHNYFPSMATQFNADDLLAGCLVSLLKQRFPLVLENRKILAGSIAVLLPVAIVPSYISHTAAIFAIGAALILSVQHPALNRAFSFRPLERLGVLSYSLYVWQQLFGHIEHPARPWLVLPALAMAWLSYEYIEQPGLRFGARFGGRKSTLVSV